MHWTEDHLITLLIDLLEQHLIGIRTGSKQAITTIRC